jgi:beta-phosphoglucomutase-like phosphatase (HAD superfamily)
MNLYLFDVDNTLLDVDHIHYQAYEEMYKNVFNVEHSLSLPEGQERTTYNIIRCALSGQVPGSKIEGQMKEAVESMVRLYFSRVNPLFVHSNAQNILDNLRVNHMVGVFTGGARNVTDAILKMSKLHDKFHHISTCDDAPTRKEIVAHAIEKASFGRKFDKIFVIGDSPDDIKAAKANNAIAVALPHYQHTKEELYKAGADIVFDDWKDTELVLEKLK